MSPTHPLCQSLLLLLMRMLSAGETQELPLRMQTEHSFPLLQLSSFMAGTTALTPPCCQLSELVVPTYIYSYQLLLWLVLLLLATTTYNMASTSTATYEHISY
jgi:hypothetical protein